jgi:hypothetical protein
MSRLENKIEANNRSIFEVLDNKKYTVDYYQREYSWEQMHIEQLVTDLCNAFLDSYDPSHQRQNVADYNSYYLGPFVLSEKSGKRSIIDGQQRLTSLTLFLIYLNNKQKELGLAILRNLFLQGTLHKCFDSYQPILIVDASASSEGVYSPWLNKASRQEVLSGTFILKDFCPNCSEKIIPEIVSFKPSSFCLLLR